MILTSLSRYGVLREVGHAREESRELEERVGALERPLVRSADLAEELELKVFGEVVAALGDLAERRDNVERRVAAVPQLLRQQVIRSAKLAL